MKKLFIALVICCGMLAFVSCFKDEANNTASNLLLLTAGSAANVDCLNVTGQPGACYTNVSNGWCTTFSGTVHTTGWCTSNGYTNCSLNRCTM